MIRIIIFSCFLFITYFLAFNVIICFNNDASLIWFSLNINFLLVLFFHVLIKRLLFCKILFQLFVETEEYKLSRDAWIRSIIDR